jgi:hypothetical protein
MDAIPPEGLALGEALATLDTGVELICATPFFDDGENPVAGEAESHVFAAEGAARRWLRTRLAALEPRVPEGRWYGVLERRWTEDEHGPDFPRILSDRSEPLDSEYL